MPTRTLASVVAIVCAVVAFFVGPVLGFFLGLAAILFGLIGMARAVSPSRRGGILSTLAVVLGAVAVVVKIVHGALKLIF
jgi:hypothetical protein